VRIDFASAQNLLTFRWAFARHLLTFFLAFFWSGGPSKEITEHARRMEGRNLQAIFGAQAEEQASGPAGQGQVSPPPSDSLIGQTAASKLRKEQAAAAAEEDLVASPSRKIKPISPTSNLIAATTASSAVSTVHTCNLLALGCPDLCRH